MKNLLAIDFGLKRVGLALGDLEKKYIYGYKTIEVNNIDDLVKKISQVVKEKEIFKIIIGYPKGLKGEETERGKVVKKFKEKLEKLIDREIILFDERYTTDLAKRIIFPKDFKKSGLKKKESIKKEINLLSAILLLESYLKGEGKDKEV
ncbi:MAG: Holliday junction resolvase RuvX [candidate division WOR-3 bacterium]|nr:Holliday junction resolvase RuvX [candidate division WOR-3 bacterium]MCX7837463.1 Holliday junction resolvase RuvX [candidate division WOR-3 bacterium]MDW8114038.1 Holliday junction resolvase RuvX [candidate division WOR-3 bacterium]